MVAKVFKCKECKSEFNVLTGICPKCGKMDLYLSNWINPEYRIDTKIITLKEKGGE